MSLPLKLGYLPLTDALPLLVAREQGLFAAEGLEVALCQLRSWAQLRDALLLGELQAAHCLAGIPLAAQAGLFGRSAPLATALTLNHFGNAICLSRSLVADIGEGRFDTGLREAALRRRDSSRPLTLASVFPVSKHEFELRHWLRGYGLEPDVDVNLVVVPPPLVDQALQSGQIHGFCVGEPWGSLSEAAGTGHIVATSQSLGLPGTEKVLAVHEAFLDRPEHHALVRALDRACVWLGEPANRQAAIRSLAGALSLPAASLAPALDESLTDRPRPEFAGRQEPDPAHARWLLAQMAGDGRELDEARLEATVARSFRADLYRQIIRGDAPATRRRPWRRRRA